MAAGPTTPTAAVTPGSVTNSPAPSVRSIASHEGSASGKTSASTASGGSGHSPNSSASWGSHHAASTLHALASGHAHPAQSPQSGQQREAPAQSNASGREAVDSQSASVVTSAQTPGDTRKGPTMGSAATQAANKGVTNAPRHVQPIAAKPPSANKGADVQRAANTSASFRATSANGARSAASPAGTSVKPAQAPPTRNQSGATGSSAGDSKSLFTSTPVSSRAPSAAAQTRPATSQATSNKIGPDSQSSAPKSMKISVPFKQPLPVPAPTPAMSSAPSKTQPAAGVAAAPANTSSAKRRKANRACSACQKAHLTCDDSRPCQRCVKKGIAQNCTDGARKKAKYLLDDDELLELKKQKEAKKRAKENEAAGSRTSASEDPAEQGLARDGLNKPTRGLADESMQNLQQQQQQQWPEDAAMMSVLQPTLFEGSAPPTESFSTSAAPADFFGTVSAFSPAMQTASFGPHREGATDTDSSMGMGIQLQGVEQQGQVIRLDAAEQGVQGDSVFHGPAEFGSEATSLEYSFLSSMLHGIDPHLLGGATPETDSGSHGSGGAATGGAYPGTPTASGPVGMMTAGTWQPEGLLGQPFPAQQMAPPWQPRALGGPASNNGRVANLPHLHMGNSGAGGWRWEGDEGVETAPTQTQEKHIGGQPAWDAEVDYEREGSRDQASETQNVGSVGYAEERGGAVRTMHVMPPSSSTAEGQGESYGGLEVPSPNDARGAESAHAGAPTAARETHSTLETGQGQPHTVLRDLQPKRGVSGPDLEWRQRVKHVYSDQCKPFAYTEGYHFLLKHITARYEKSEVLRIVRALAIFRPSLIALQMPLTEDDEIFVERSIQRTILELEKLISFSGTPTVVWRRTCEICVVGMEFCMLTQRTRDSLLGRYVYEFFDTDSSLRYWESFALHAFENTASAVSMTVKLLASDGRVIPCAACFSIKRDQFDLPSLVVGNFLPLL